MEHVPFFLSRLLIHINVNCQYTSESVSASIVKTEFICITTKPILFYLNGPDAASVRRCFMLAYDSIWSHAYNFDSMFNADQVAQLTFSWSLACTLSDLLDINGVNSHEHQRVLSTRAEKKFTPNIHICSQYKFVCA